MKTMKKFRIIALLILTIASASLFTSCESNDATTYPTQNSTPPLTLLLPLNNSTVNTLSVQFDWADLPLAIGYGLQISTDAAFTNVVYDTSGFSTSAVTLNPGAISDSSSYYWRVRGITSSDTTDWTSSSSFSVQTNVVSANNKVLIEMFTNTSCVPCVVANTYLDRIHNLEGVTNNDAEVVLIRIHSTLYPNDPFYLFNSTDNDFRQNYYNGGIFNPQAFLNGSFMNNYNANTWTNLINTNFGALSSYAITYNNSYDTTSRNGDISVTVNQITGTQVGDLVLHVAVTEDDLMYNAPNGETEFNNVLRDLITPGNGATVNVSAGQSTGFNYSYNINGQINDNNTHVIMFLQSTSTKQVYAVEELKLR